MSKTKNDTGGEKQKASASAKDSKTKKYIITAAQACYYYNNEGDLMPWGGGPAKAVPHEKFLKGLETIAAERGAELIIMPIAGKRVTESVLHEKLRDRDDIFWGKMLRLNSNIQLRDIVVPPQNVDPTSGKASLVSEYNSALIYAHAKQRYLPVPVFNARLPRYLYTTGAVTRPNYNLANHRGDTAHRNHVYGALLVEVVDNDSYNIRNLRAMQNGKFVDLGVEYNGSKAPKKVGVDSLVLGDIHWTDHDEKTIAANYEMIDYFNPQRIFLHDFFNGTSVSPFDKKKHLLRIRDYKQGFLSLEAELKADYKELVRMSRFAGKRTKIYMVSSNHHAFLPVYINDCFWIHKDLWNADIGAYLFEKGINKNETIDDSQFLLKEGLKKFGPLPSNVEFLGLNDNLRRHGYQLASHGHKGPHGARGGRAKSRAITGGGKSITGHSHFMEIVGNTYMVGTSSRLDLDYASGGASAWIAANAVLYKNGIVQMVPIIDGHWRLRGKYL